MRFESSLDDKEKVIYDILKKQWSQFIGPMSIGKRTYVHGPTNICSEPHEPMFIKQPVIGRGCKETSVREERGDWRG